jgi:oligopeptide transport system substrate-binding protein
MTTAVTATFAVAIACGEDNESPDANGSGDTTAGTPKSGGEITIQHRPFGSFDPHFTAFGRDISQQGMVFRGLYKLDKDDKLQPELAEAMPQISSDGKTYTVKLKSGLKWSDGQPLTSKDVVAGFQRTCNPTVAGQYSANLFNIVGCKEYYTSEGKSAAEQDALLQALGVRALDEQTTEIKLTQAQASFGIQLALWFSWPSPSHIVTTPGAEWPADPTRLVFSGPFKVTSFKEKESMVLERNENYGGSHLAYLDKITLRYIENLETANNAYRTGELLLTRANDSALDVLRADPKLSKELNAATKSPSTQGLTMYIGAPPLDNAKLRLALSQATDRETLNKVVLKDAHIPTTTWIPVDLIGESEDPFKSTIGFDPEKAKKTFSESGAPKDLRIKVSIIDTPSQKGVAAFFQEQWNKHLGINVDVEVLDSPSLQKLFQDEKYQVVLQGWTQDFPDAENWVDGLYNSDGPNNHYGCKNTKLDDLLEEARTNLNDVERRSQYKEINRLIAEEICGVAPLYHQRVFYLTAPQLKGPREFSTSQDRYLGGDWAVEEWWLDD